MPGIKEICAERLKKVRERSGKTQAEFAQAVGISRTALSYYENGERAMDIEVLDRICQYAKCPVGYLMGTTESKEMNNAEIGETLGLSDESIGKLKSNHCVSKFTDFLISDEDYELMCHAALTYLMGIYGSFKKLKSTEKEYAGTPYPIFYRQTSIGMYTNVIDATVRRLRTDVTQRTRVEDLVNYCQEHYQEKKELDALEEFKLAVMLGGKVTKVPERSIQDDEESEP